MQSAEPASRTRSTLGVGATYDWRFTLFGFPVFRFREQVIEWVEGRVVTTAP